MNDEPPKLVLKNHHGIHQNQMFFAPLPGDGLPQPDWVLQLPRFAAHTLR
jgi:hypothetical protein